MPLDLSLFGNAIKILEEERVTNFNALAGSSGALLFSMISSPCLLLCPTEETASEFYADSLSWSQSLETPEPILIRPKDHPERLKSLADIYNAEETSSTLSDGTYNPNSKKIISSVEAAMSPVWKTGEFALLRISRGGQIERDSLIADLQKKGYYTVPVVSGRGEMSIRGGLLDIFTPDSTFPVRIEFFGDRIESIRLFDTDSQLSVKEIETALICPAVEPDEGLNLIELLDKNRLMLNEPNDIRRRYPDLIHSLEQRKIFNLTSLPIKEEGSLDISGISGFGLLPEERENIGDFIKRVSLLRGHYFILMVCSSEGQAHRLRDLFSEESIDVPVVKNTDAIKYVTSPVITTGELSRGFAYHKSIILTERDIFGKRPVFKPIKRSRVSHLISSIEDFKEGDYLVHLEHGIGRFMGIKKETIEGYEGEFMIIEYVGGDRLYVPLERIDCIQNYHAPDHVGPVLDRLGGKTWQKTKKRAKEKIKDMAQKLLKIYARRSEAEGYAFSEDKEMHYEFDDFFSYKETPDQQSSIEEIKRDMESSTPMDRILCGDVGYGKTEVAMRACFKAVYDSKQAVVLVPTTILAEQHYETFTSRFSAFPVKIDFLSRFKNRAEQKQTLKALSEGETDIIIGTQRLLGKDVSFHDLGLLIIDEEHKFGVAHKEKLKALKAGVDILTLTATPIPRTLHMALSGIRNISVIETPPEERLAVKSLIAKFDPAIIKDALKKELDRGGQAFFIHNRIHDIYNIANLLRGLIPEGKIAVAHGQLRGIELERIMRSFYKKESNILVSTSIIGSGLDIPSANTIMINRADRFGLADLYQLRGRVGRSNVKAYAWFLIPGEDAITEEARKKVQAVQELSYLGAGFRLAMKDLEIRGAGNLLGAEQSGHVEAVGYDLYITMLEEAVAELKGEDVPSEIEPVLDLRVTAVIPEYYIKDSALRLNIYRKIAAARDSEKLGRLKDELKDRFGTLPEETKRLVEIMELKTIAKRLAVTAIHNRDGKIKILFAHNTLVTPEMLFSLYKKGGDPIKFLPEGGIELDLTGKEWGEIFKKVMGVLKDLSA
jgi:transcription-repair coupling factor (superfamily II helicase)